MPDHDHSGCNTDPDLLRSTRLEPSHSRNQLKPSPDRSLGVVLMGMRITKVHKDAIPHISGDEPAEVAHGLGDAFLIGRNDLSQVLRVHAGGKRGRTDQVREHHRDLAALGFVPWARVGPRRKLGRGGGGSGKLGNRLEQFPAISKRHDAKLLLEILVREVLKDRKIDPVFGKAVRILGQAKRSQPLSDRRHCVTRPVARVLGRGGAGPPKDSTWTGDRCSAGFRPGLCPLWVMCERRPIDKSFFTLMQHWSGTVMCPACWCGTDGRWP